jgi:hypothetical protein
MQTKQISASVIAKADLPDEVLKAAEGEDIDKWFYATVEVQDVDGDIVRIKGLNTEKHARNGHIKVLVSHQLKPDGQGRLPIAGKVAKWVQTKHKATGAPALAAGLKFVGTELGKEIKTLSDADLLDVSIGFEPLESSPIQGAGLDYTKAAIAEISVCVHGANQFAGVVRAIDKELGLGTAEPVLPSAHATPEEHKAFFATAIEKLDALLASAAQLKKDLTSTAETTDTQFKAIADRFDDIEDSVAALPKGSADPQGDRKDQQTPKTIDRDRLSAFLSTL